MRYFFLFLFLPALSPCSFGQLQKIIHQTFAVDSIRSIKFNVFGDFEVEPWAGDAVLTQTTIKLYDASEGVLNHLMKAGRYNLEEVREADRLVIRSRDQVRAPIRTSKGEGYEQVEVKIFIPGSFRPGATLEWIRDKLPGQQE